MRGEALDVIAAGYQPPAPAPNEQQCAERRARIAAAEQICADQIAECNQQCAEKTAIEDGRLGSNDVVNLRIAQAVKEAHSGQSLQRVADPARHAALLTQA